MQTNYQQLTPFETATVGLIFVGLLIVGFQIFSALPAATQAQAVAVLEIFDINDSLQEPSEVISIVFNGMQDFQEQFYLASMEIFHPVAEEALATAGLWGGAIKTAFNNIAEVSDSLAQNHQSNYAPVGVETGSGGEVLGAFIIRLSE